MNTKPLLLDQKEEEVMLPIPSAAQDLLWDEIYTSVKQEDLMREVKWFEVPLEIRKYLGSIETSKKIDEIGVRFSLGYGQISALAKNIKYVFIKEVPLKDFISAVVKDLKIENKVAGRISQDVKTEIFVPMREYLLRIYPPAKLAEERLVSKPVVVPISASVLALPVIPAKAGIQSGNESKKNLDSPSTGNDKEKSENDTKINKNTSVTQQPTSLPTTPLRQGSAGQATYPTSPRLRGASSLQPIQIIQPEKMRSDLNTSKLQLPKSELKIPPVIERKVVREKEFKPEQFKSVSDTQSQGISLDHFYEKMKTINSRSNQLGVELSKSMDSKNSPQVEKEAPIVWHSSSLLGKDNEIQDSGFKIQEKKDLKLSGQSPVSPKIITPSSSVGNDINSSSLKSSNLKVNIVNEKERDEKLSEQLSKMPIRTMGQDMNRE